MKRSHASIFDVPKETLRARNTRENDRRYYMGTLALIRDALCEFTCEVHKYGDYYANRLRELLDSLSLPPSEPGNKDTFTVLVTAKPVTLTEPVDLHIVSAGAWQALDNVRRYIKTYEKRSEGYDAFRLERNPLYEMYYHVATEMCTTFDARVIADAYENCTFLELARLDNSKHVESYNTPMRNMKF